MPQEQRVVRILLLCQRRAYGARGTKGILHWACVGMKRILCWAYEEMKGTLHWTYEEMKGILRWAYEEMKGIPRWAYVGMKGILTRQAHRALEKVLATEGPQLVGLQGHAHEGILIEFAQEEQMAKEHGEEGGDRSMSPVDHGMGMVPGIQGVRTEKEHAAPAALEKYHGEAPAALVRALEHHMERVLVPLHRERALWHRMERALWHRMERAL